MTFTGPVDAAATETDILQVERLGESERVTLNRPARLNALNQPLTEAPSWAKRRAAAVPMPGSVDAPATMATFPSKRCPNR